MKKGTFYVRKKLDEIKKVKGFLFGLDGLSFGCYCIARKNREGVELSTGLRCTQVSCDSKEAVKKEVERLYDEILALLKTKCILKQIEIFTTQISEIEKQKNN